MTNNPPQTFIDEFAKANINISSATQYWESLNQEVVEDFLLWIYQQPFFHEQNKTKLGDILTKIVDNGMADQNILDYIKPMLDYAQHSQCINQYSLLFTLKLKQVYDLISHQSALINK